VVITLTPWRPDRVIAPGTLLAAWLAESQMTDVELALMCAGGEETGRVIRVIRAVLARRRYGEATAALLASGTSVPPAFWLALEHDYRAGLTAGLTDASDA